VHKNILLLYGAEDYLINEKVRDLIHNVDNAEFNISTFQNYDNELQIVESCYQLPFLADKRVVVVYGDLFSGEKKLIENYLSNPNNSTILVFVVPNVDKRKKLYKNIEKIANITEFKKLRQVELSAFIKNYLHRKGYDSISQECVETVIENTAYLLIEEISLHDVVSELDRLVDYVGATNSIKTADINTIIKPPAETNVFKLFPLIASKKAAEAISYMDGLLKSGTNAMFILSQILRPYRILYKLKTTGNATELGLTTFMVKDIAKEIDSMSAGDIAEKMSQVVDTQKLIQNGIMSDELALQLLVSNLLM